MASINYKVAGFSPNVKNDLGVIQRNDFRRDGAYSKDGVTPSRFSYNFDGVDDYGVLATRAINPDGDIDVSWYQAALPASGTRVIVTQCDSSTLTSREFNFIWNSSVLEMLVGGTAVIATADSVNASIGFWRVFYSGTTVQVFFNEVLIRTLTSRTRGAAREPAAPTRIGVRNNGGAPLEFYRGIIYNLKINGVLRPMADRNQVIQLPSPSGLGAELITPTVLANPAVKGSQWTFLGDGRWQYVGDGSLNELRFIVSPSQPEAGYLEFEVDSITGSMVCNTAGSTNAQFNSTGVKRYFYTQKLNSTSDGNTIVFKCVAGITASCIIKNISFKPLWVADDAQLVTNGDFSGGTAGWFVTGGGSMAVNSGQATLTTTAGQVSRFERGVTLEAGAYYEASVDLVSISGVASARLSLIRDSAGGFRGIASLGLSAPGKIVFAFMAPATDAIIQIVGDSVNAGTMVVDNVSIRKLDSLCNPLQMINTTTDRWQEIIE